MCGVIGYVGVPVTVSLLFQGLKKLEYRGYDSAGIAVLDKTGEFVIERAEGKLVALEQKLKQFPASIQLGMGHTRWATHGKPSENNAHPHRSGNIVLLHNGIIENYKELKKRVLEAGYVFSSETDTEVAAHLLDFYFKQAPKKSVPEFLVSLSKLTQDLRGAFAFGILCQEFPEHLFVVKHGSPIVLGRSENAHYMASGLTALVEHTRTVHFMEDKEIAVLNRNEIQLYDFDLSPKKSKFQEVNWTYAQTEKGEHRHYMMKEMHEEPSAVMQTLEGRVSRSTNLVDKMALGLEKVDLNQVERVQVIACGTSYYAGCLSAFAFEELTGLPCDVYLASEYRYRRCTANAKTLAIAVSQSGESMDTLQAIRYAKAHGAQTIGVLNVPGSSIGQECLGLALTHAGPEVCVASTKAFFAQVACLDLIAIALAQTLKSIDEGTSERVMEELYRLPLLIEKSLGSNSLIEKLGHKYHKNSSVLFIGRGPNWPVSLEGALKLKELSYIHAESYAAGELKHGPIALIDENMLVVCVAPKDKYYEKTLSNIEEIKARGGKILSIGTAGDLQLAGLSDDFIPVPTGGGFLGEPLLCTVPLHLLSYWIAVKKGTDVDQPRNLAKSVTVE